MAQVQGEEIYLSHSGQEVDDNIDEVVAARGSEASLSARLADIVSDFDADQQRQEAEIGAVAAQGAKNLLKVTASSGVLNTATIDIAGDGAIHITGQPTANGAYVISSGIELVIPENAYILSMGAEAGNTKMSISLRRAGTSQYVDLYMAESRIIPAGTYDRAHIYLYRDTNYDTTVYPMIRQAEITDGTFQPYAKTNRELTIAEGEDRAALISQVDNGAKNLAVPRNLANESGLTITNDKGQYTITGTTTSAFTGYLFRPAEPLQINTDCVIIGAEQLTGLSYIVAYKVTANANTRYESIGTKKILPSGAVILYIYVQQRTVGTVVSAKINLMMCTAEDYAISPAFVPYAPTNRELYEMILALQSGVSAQSSAASLMQAGRIDAAELTAAEPAAAETGEETDA